MSFINLAQMCRFCIENYNSESIYDNIEDYSLNLSDLLNFTFEIRVSAHWGKSQITCLMKIFRQANK